MNDKIPSEAALQILAGLVTGRPSYSERYEPGITHVTCTLMFDRIKVVGMYSFKKGRFGLAEAKTLAKERAIYNAYNDEVIGEHVDSVLNERSSEV